GILQIRFKFDPVRIAQIEPSSQGLEVIHLGLAKPVIRPGSSYQDLKQCKSIGTYHGTILTAVTLYTSTYRKNPPSPAREPILDPESYCGVPRQNGARGARLGIAWLYD